MKKLFLGFLVSVFSISGISAFRDVQPRAKVYEPLQTFIEQGILEDGSFFRPFSDVPMIMFLDIILRESKIEFIETEIVEENFPPNITKDSALFSLVQTSIDEELISPKKEFEPLASISKMEALKTIITLKTIVPPRRISPSFRKQYGEKIPGNLIRSIDGRYLEAGIASSIITKNDLETIHENLSRQELIFWLTNYRNGDGNRSKIAKDNPYIPSKKLTVLVNGKDIGPISKRLKDSSRDGYQFPEEFIFEKVYQDILEKYRFIDELTKERRIELINAAIEGMVKNLEDTHSSYIVPERSRDYLDALKGNFEGIGAYVEMIKGKFTITAPISGSPAERVGIRAKDIVTHVDEEAVAGKSIREIIALIKGPAGTDVALTILRENEELIISVTREKVIVPDIEFEMIQSVPVIRLKTFDDDLVKTFKSIVEENVIGKNRKGLILDFRNNTGGLLDQATELAEMFSRKGEDLLKIDYRDEKRVVKSRNDGLLVDQKNIIILQNGGSASASEVFISFLKFTKRADIWGSKSYGKGTVQQLLKYSNSGVMKITIARWLTPDNEWVHKIGILPDKEFADRTPEEVKNKKDLLLDAAVREILNR